LQVGNAGPKPFAHSQHVAPPNPVLHAQAQCEP